MMGVLGAMNGLMASKRRFAGVDFTGLYRSTRSGDLSSMARTSKSW
jgi:hypothetical protein